MIQAAPDRFFKPPYVGPSGWIGIFLDRGVDWAEVGELLRDAYLLTAPKRLAAGLGMTTAKPAKRVSRSPSRRK